MTSRKIFAVACVAVLLAPGAASAQFASSLKGLIPNSPKSNTTAPANSTPAAPNSLGSLLGAHKAAPASAVDPDRFLADTVETTKFIMVAAAVLADAASASPDQAALAARIKSINEVKDVKELDAHRGEFQQDADALAQNKELTAQIQANLDHADAQQRQRVASAAFNFALGVFRNAKLAQEAPQVVNSIRANPRLMMKAPEIMLAAKLVAVEVRDSAGMVGSLHTIMTASKIAEPEQAETTKPKPIDIA